MKLIKYINFTIPIRTCILSRFQVSTAYARGRNCTGWGVVLHGIFYQMIIVMAKITLFSNFLTIFAMTRFSLTVIVRRTEEISVGNATVKAVVIDIIL